jgi:hypothetical protein
MKLVGLRMLVIFGRNFTSTATSSSARGNAVKMGKVGNFQTDLSLDAPNFAMTPIVHCHIKGLTESAFLNGA